MFRNSIGRSGRRRRRLAEYKELDERCNKQSDRDLTKNKALGEGQVRGHIGRWPESGGGYFSG